MQISDNIYLGGFPGGGLNNSTPDSPTGSSNPIWSTGIGPAGRIVYYDAVPLTAAAANVAALQHTTNGTALTLTAGTGVTAGVAPDGSGLPVIVFDVSRAVSLTSTSDLHLINFLITGFDYLGRKQTQLKAGPNVSTVNTLKTFKSILSVVPDTTDGTHNVSVGTSDIFGMPWLIANAVYVQHVGWNSALANDAGTFVAADATTPATNLTGDPRGTYLPSSASDGAKRLVLGAHLTSAQCGPQSTLLACLGVPPV